MYIKTKGGVMDKANKFNSEKLVNGDGTIEEMISEDMGKSLIIMHRAEIDPDEASLLEDILSKAGKMPDPDLACRNLFGDVYKGIIQNIKASSCGMSQEAHKSLLDKQCSKLIVLGFYVYAHFDDSKWGGKIADAAARYAGDFNNNLRIAELYLRQKLSREKAGKCLKRAARHASSAWEHSQVADMVGNLLKDKVWGRVLIRKAEKKCRSSLDYCILGETVSHPDGFNDRDEAARYFRIALEKAENDRRRDDVLDSIEDCLEEKWENGKISKIVY
jgi:hypothetical protein